MTFNDDDLRRLKERWDISRQSDDTWFGIDRYEAQALLGRLEAAERVIDRLVSYQNHTYTNNEKIPFVKTVKDKGVATT